MVFGSCKVIVGAQFGDEAKGKIVDAIAGSYDYVARFNGGNNAGHTVKAGSKTFKLHLLPSGILKKGVRNLVGSGVVLDPKALLEEIGGVQKQGVAVTSKNLGLDYRCHLVMPWHVLQDKAASKIGTTGRGIGPCYEDKAARTGVRLEDLEDAAALHAKVYELVSAKKKLLASMGADASSLLLDAKKIASEYAGCGKKLAQYVCDVSMELNEAIDGGKKILFEGAQGTLLDDNYGTYPFVTSSNSISGAATVGAGVPPSALKEVEGVVKAYTTRVGNGPFPTELTGALGDKIREKGAEYGTTTGRPRRVGWLDIPMLRMAAQVNGFTGVHLTKLDVLGGIGKLKVAVGYASGAKTTRYSPRPSQLGAWKPEYVEVGGFEGLSSSEWRAVAIRGRKLGLKALPVGAQAYVKKVQELIGVKLASVSVGPEREETIWLK